jgi:HlyD family secretion protein
MLWQLSFKSQPTAAMARRKKNSWIKWLIILLLLGGGGYYGWKRFGTAPVDDAPQLKSEAIKKGQLVQKVTASGTINPLLNVQVGSQISGQITALHVDFNSRVKAGDIVAEIDPATYKTRLLQNDADLSSARASLQLAEVNARRAEDLFNAKLISQSEHDTTMANLAQAKAQVQTREAQMNSTKVDLERCTIYSPIDGIVIDRKVDVGQTVAASMNAPLLFMIANDLKKMQINASVAEADIGGVENEQKVKFTVDAFPGRSFEGKVVQVRNAAVTVQNVVSYDTIIDVDNRDEKLKPGMTANVEIITAEKNDVLVIPNAALRFKPPEGVIVKEAEGAPKSDAPKTIEVPDNPEALLAKMKEYRDKGEPTPQELRDKMREMVASGKINPQEAFGGRGPGGGGPGGPGGGRGPGAGGPGGGRGGGGGGQRPASAPTEYTVYLLAKSDASVTNAPVITVVEPRKIRTGITDGIKTEVISGLTEGDVVVTGEVLNIQSGSAPAATNPFSSGSRRGR